MILPDETTDRDRRLDEILGAYYVAVEAGQSVDRSEWLERHPGFAAELSEFFAEQERIHRLMSPLREPSPEQIRADSGGPAQPWDTAPPRPEDGDASTSGRARRFGDYELLAEIDRGGMGVVYRARQRSLDRLVAVKMIAPGRFPTDTALARFRNEARVVANLDHPGIVPIYEVGVHCGLSYFSMKLMEGGSLADRLTEYTSDTRSAARLLAEVARAVHHAHQRGVLHRDLKPSNILLDAEGTPYVGDFGLARRVEQGAGAEPALTLTGELLGSPAYMAPEQTVCLRDAVSVATDIYGLGAVLYALLTGRPPFRAGSVVDTLEAVRRDAPELPSRVNARVAPDLQAICLKCLEKDPDRRYSSARELAEDLDRFLAGEPTLARPPGLTARARHWGGRHRRQLGWTAVGLVITALAVLGGFLTHRLEETRQIANTHAEDLLLRDRKAHHAYYVEQVRLAAQLIRAGDARKGEAVLDALEPKGPGDDDLRGFEWHYLRGLLRQERRSWSAHEGREVYHVTFSRDGRTIATCGADGTARLWDAASLTPAAVLRGHKGDVNGVDFAPDGRTLATVGDDATLRFWRADGSTLGRPLPALGTPVPSIDEPWALAVAFDHAGRRVYSGGGDAKVRIWDSATHSQVGMIELLSRVGGLALSPDDSQMAMAVSNPDLAWFDLNATGGPTRRIPVDSGLWADVTASVVFSPDGKTLAVTNDRNIELWDVATGRHRATLGGHLTPIDTLAMAPDSRTLASADQIGTVRLWDITQPTAGRVLLGHRDRVWGCAFSPDGRTLATCSRDRTVKLWDVQARPDRLTLPGTVYTCSVAFRDVHTLVAAETSGEVRTVNLNAGSASNTTKALVTDVPAYQCWTLLSPQGGHVAATSSPSGVQVWSLEGTAGPATFPGASDAALSPDGSLFAAREAGGRVVLRETATLRERGSLDSRTARAFAVAPDGAVLAFDPEAPGGAMLALCDAGKGSRASLRLPREPWLIPQWNAFSPDGRWLAIAAEDASVVLLDGRTLNRVADLRGHAAKVHALAFSPDGRTLATGGDDGTVRVWHVESAQEVLLLESHRGELKALAFSPDGRALAVATTPLIVYRADDR